MLHISHQLSIAESELQFTYSRSGGPGGQNVNKVNSKATLRWSVVNTQSLPQPVRERFVQKYGSRLTKNGTLLLSSQRFRDQPKNASDCRERLVEMIRSVLRPPRTRRETTPTKGSRERRLRT